MLAVVQHEEYRVGGEPDDQRLHQRRRVRRAFLGLVSSPAPLPPVLAERLGRREGLRLVEVVPGSPAARAGLFAGDVLLTVGGQAVSTAQSVQRLMFAEAIGKDLPITVWRRGALVDVIARPVELTGQG